jgi:HPt (histidine-containing phosphotransfer) domain-containing protein
MSAVPRELMQRYVASLSEKAEFVDATLDELRRHPTFDQLENLRAFCHRLAGSAGMYGFENLGNAARSLAHQIEDLREKSGFAIDQGFAHVAPLCEPLQAAFVNVITPKIKPI